MMKPYKVVSSAIAGLLLGVAVMSLIIVAAVGFAFVTSTELLIPGVFRTWFTTENDMPALNFQPNFVGILVAIAVVAVVHVLSTIGVGNRVAKRKHKIDD